MKEKNGPAGLRKEMRALRQQNKRIEESRSSIKAKNREKGNIIKAQRDREAEIQQSRDNWKEKCKEQEKERIDAEDSYKRMAAECNIKEELLREILKEHEELKKKYTEQRRKQKTD